MPSIFKGWCLKRVPLLGLLLTLWGTLSLAADIGRGLDPVIVKGQNLPALLGKDTIGLRVFAYNAEEIAWYPVPFQIDEVAAVRDSGYYTIKNSILDPIDELVFMARDLGDQAGERIWFEDATAVQYPRYEIAVQNPLTGAMGYLYVYWSPFMATSSTSYISYANETIHAATYEAGQTTSKAGGLLTSLVIPAAAGGDGLNLLDEQRLRITTKASYTLVKQVTLQIQEQWKKTYTLNLSLGNAKVGEINVDVKHAGFKHTAGPVRIVRTNYLSISLSGYARIQGVVDKSFNQSMLLPIGYKFYPDFYEMPFDSVVINLGESFTQMDGLSLTGSTILFCSALNANALGMRYYTPRLTTEEARLAGFKVDQKTDDLIYKDVAPLAVGEWPGKHWYGFTSDTIGTDSPAQHATLFTIADLRGNPPMSPSPKGIRYVRYADNNSDDGTPMVYGLNGIQLYEESGLPASIPLILTLRQYVFPQVYSYRQMETLYNTYKTPLGLTTTRQMYDIIPPGTITDLEIAGRTDSTLTLSWTAVGDDCTRVRAATAYLMRYSTEKPDGNRDWTWWANAMPIYSTPVPSAPGGQERMIISGLAPERQYYFGIRTLDEADNASPSIAMVTSATTPVELTAFAARVNENRIDLTWQTASESSNLGFALERRMEGESDWHQIAFLKGQGTTTTAQSYSWSDGDIQPGVLFYRLKQVDTDGSFAYSDPVSVTFQAPAKWALAQNFPNPFNPATTLSYQIPAHGTGTVELTVYDLLGRRIRQLVREEARAGYYRLDWDGCDDQGVPVGSGVYMYILTAPETHIVRKMIKLQ
jgi:hypothetical protein